MLTAKVFQSGNSQAIRIPKEMRTTQEEFIVTKLGDILILYPPNDPWFLLRNTIGKLSEDFMSDYQQPTWSDIPEREEF